jgi:hypothetical protein
MKPFSQWSKEEVEEEFGLYADHSYGLLQEWIALYSLQSLMRNSASFAGFLKTNDPTGQLLAEMVAAQKANPDTHPIYGA